jgi:hypothetical protein
MGKWFDLPEGYPGAGQTGGLLMATVPLDPTLPKHKKCLDQATLCPIFANMGHNIGIYRYFDFTKLERSADYDNRFATWMMIDPVSGFAPPDWQMQIGPVLVVRKDGSVTLGDITILTDWLGGLLDQWGDGYVTRETVSKKQFTQFAQRFAEHWSKADIAKLTIL